MTIALPAESAQRRSVGIDMSWPVLLTFAALLFVLIVLPISWLIYYSLVDGAGVFTRPC
jgi:ABC-type spermidine/putrescine transport system permease subunit II